MSDRYLVVEENDNFAKDVQTHAIVNVSQDSYRTFLSKQKKRIAQNQKIETLQNEVNELRALVQSLIQKD